MTKYKKNYPGVGLVGLQYALVDDPEVHITYTLQYVIQPGKIGLIAYLKVLRNSGLKYSVCCSTVHQWLNLCAPIFTPVIL